MTHTPTTQYAMDANEAKFEIVRSFEICPITMPTQGGSIERIVVWWFPMASPFVYF
jgi:hypothetical protein